MKKITLLLFLIMLSVEPTFAQRVPIKNVAVVETELDAQSGAAEEISKAEVREITATLRREAVRALPRDRYNVMTSETVQSMGGAVLEECAEENCIITLGSKIGADYIVRGIISKFRAMFSLTVELYETDYGNLIASADAVRSASLEELLEKGQKACADMYKRFVEIGPQTTPAPEPVLASDAQPEYASAPKSRAEPKPQPAPEPQKAPLPPPQKPIRVMAFADSSSNAVYIHWSPVPNAAGYKIYRKVWIADGTYTYDSTSVAEASPFTDAWLLAGTKYYYKVAAYNDWGTGPLSRAVSATIPVPKSKPRPEPKPKPALAPKPEPNAKAPEKPVKPSVWIGLGVDAIGAGIIAYGIAENGSAAKLVNTGWGEDDYRQAENHAKSRNTAYAIGAVVLLSGISIKIFF